MSTDDQLRALLTSAQQQHAAVGDSLKAMASLLTSSTPAATLTVRATPLSADSVTVTWDTTLTPSGWTVGRDGQDANGSGPWQTQVPDAAPHEQRFTSLRPATKYTFFVAPVGGEPVTVSATTSAGTSTGGTTPVDPTAAHGPRALADGWVPLLRASDDFGGQAVDAGQWSMYNSVGHGGNGLRRPGQFSIVDDPTALGGKALRVVGTTDGTTGGMAHKTSQWFGRWAIRMRADGDQHYHQVGLTWPSAENWPAGGEIDFAEGNAAKDQMQFFLHYSSKNQQTSGSAAVDRRSYAWYEVEWTPDYVAGWCDGREFFRDTNRAHFNYPEFGAHHLCLQLDWFPDGATKTGGAQMWVDAIRVYRHPKTEG